MNYPIQKLIDDAYGDWPVTCTDCGKVSPESLTLYMEEKHGGLLHDIPLCERCFDARERRDMAYTRLQMEIWGQRIFWLLFAVGFGCAAYWIMSWVLRAIETF